MKKIFNKAVVIIIAITLVFASVAFGGCNSGATNNDALLYELAALRQQLEQLQQSVAASNAELLEQVEELQRQMEELQAEIERLERELFVLNNRTISDCGRFAFWILTDRDTLYTDEYITASMYLKNISGEDLMIGAQPTFRFFDTLHIALASRNTIITPNEIISATYDVGRLEIRSNFFIGRAWFSAYHSVYCEEAKEYQWVRDRSVSIESNIIELTFLYRYPAYIAEPVLTECGLFLFWISVSATTLYADEYVIGSIYLKNLSGENLGFVHHGFNLMGFFGVIPNHTTGIFGSNIRKGETKIESQRISISNFARPSLPDRTELYALISATVYRSSNDSSYAPRWYQISTISWLISNPIQFTLVYQ